MRKDWEIQRGALDKITDWRWSPLNLFTKEGNLQPEYITPGEARILKFWARFLPTSWLAFLVLQIGGGEAQTMFKKMVDAGEDDLPIPQSGQ